MKIIIAFTDSITTCECCGRSNLKGTYAVKDEFGGEFYYGSTCVKRNLGYSKDDVQRDLNLSKNKAQNEYSEKKDVIKSLLLHPIEEMRELKFLREEIKNKYYLQYF